MNITGAQVLHDQHCDHKNNNSDDTATVNNNNSSNSSSNYELLDCGLKERGGEGPVQSLTNKGGLTLDAQYFHTFVVYLMEDVKYLDTSYKKMSSLRLSSAAMSS